MRLHERSLLLPRQWHTIGHCDQRYSTLVIVSLKLLASHMAEEASEFDGHGLNLKTPDSPNAAHRRDHTSRSGSYAVPRIGLAGTLN